MNLWEPDFERFKAAITRDRLPDRLPLGEGAVAFDVMEAFLGHPVTDLSVYCGFSEKAGYDYVVLQIRGQWLSDSFQIKINEGVLTFDGAQTASTFESGGVHDEASFESYPWIGPEGVYYKDVDDVEEHLPDGMKLIVNVGSLFSAAWRCMGMEVFSIAGIENPGLVEAVVEKMGSITVNIVENVVQRDYVGGIWLGDDLAYTESLIVSPDFLRRLIFPYYKQIGDLCRRYGKIFVFHSDGYLMDVFQDLIDTGIQAIHPNEPTSVDIVQVKKQWGDQVALMGNVDVDLLSRGTPQEVVDATKYLIDNVAPGGGFAVGSGNTITDYVSLANYKAMLDTVREFGCIY